MASFCINGGKILFGISVEIEGLNQEISYSNLLNLDTGYFKGVSSHIEYLLGWLYGLILANYPVTYSFIGVFFELRYQNVTWNLIQIGELNQEISYSNLPQVISRVFQVI